MLYYNKYIKYKYKYKQLINQQYGGAPTFSINRTNFININESQNDYYDIFDKLDAEIIENKKSILNYTIKIGYKLCYTIRGSQYSEYKHYTIDEFRALFEQIKENFFESSIDNKIQYIYIIKNYNNIMSEIIKENDINTTVNDIMNLVRDIIFSKQIIIFDDLYIKNICHLYNLLKQMDESITEDEYIPLFKLSIKLNYENLKYITNIENLLTPKNYLEISQYAFTINSKSIEYIKFKSNYTSEYLNMVNIAINTNGLLLKFVKNNLEKDEKVVSIAVLQNGLALEYADPEIKKNEKVVSIAVLQNGLALEYADPEIKKNEKVVSIAVLQNGLALKYADPEIKKNEKVVSIAVLQNGLVLEYADIVLKKNEKVVSIAVLQNGLALEYADIVLKKNIRVVSIASHQNGLALEYADPNIKDMQRVVSIALHQNGLALEYASSRLQQDEHIVYIAVLQNVLALEYTTSELQNALSIVRIAVRKNGLALEYADSELKKNEKIVYIAVLQNGLALEYADSELKKNIKPIAHVAVNQNGLALEYVNIQNNPHNIEQNNKDLDLILTAVRNNGFALEFVPHRFRIVEVVTEAIFQNYMVIQLVNTGVKDNILPLINDDDIIKIYKFAIKKDPICIKYILIDMLIKVLNICNIPDDRNTILYIFKHSEITLKTHNPFPVIFTDIAFAKEAIQENINCYKFCSDEVKKNIEVITLLLSIDFSYYIFIPIEQQNEPAITNIGIEKNKINNKIKDSSFMMLLHIGYLALDISHTESYTKYQFIDASVVTYEGIISAITQFKTESLTNIDTYYILISLDSISYLQYLKHTTNVAIPSIELPNALYNPSIYKQQNYMFGNPFSTTSTKLSTNFLFNDLQTCNIYINSNVNNVHKMKITSLYNNIITELNNNNNKYNINIINISDGNDLESVDHITKIVNILINKYHINDRYMSETYSKDKYKYKSLTLEIEQIYNNKLLSHWLNNLFLTPKILSKRQLQISGTCMVNSVFNSLFLVDDIKKILKRKYDEYKKENENEATMTFSRLSDKKIAKTSLGVLYSIIGNLLGDIKPKSDENYMLTLSAYVKDINYQEKHKETITRIKSLLDENFKKNTLENFFKICRASDDNSYRQIICNDDNYKSNVTDLNTICNYKTNESICNKYDIGSNEESGYIFGESGFNQFILSFFILLFNQSFEKMNDFYKKIQINTYTELIIEDIQSNILLIYVNKEISLTTFNNLKVKEKRNNKNYYLQSCLLRDETHAICGIKNNNYESNKDAPYYIYDAQNVYSTDDWSKLLKVRNRKMLLPLIYKEKIKNNLRFKETLFEVIYFIYTCKN